MEFVTLHQLSRELNMPEKNLRYRFKQLQFENQLIENEDYIRADFVDETHFTYKINPVTFMQKTGLARVPIPDNQLGTKTGINEPELDTKVDTKREEPVTKPDINVGINPYPPDMATDFIAVLKEQLRVKDEQLKRATEQVKDLQEINNMAMGEVVNLNRTIRQLAAPKSDTNGYQEGQVVDTKPDTNGYQDGYQTGTNYNEPVQKTMTPESAGEGGGA
jgi:hypothetical protein